MTGLGERDSKMAPDEEVVEANTVKMPVRPVRIPPNRIDYDQVAPVHSGSPRLTWSSTRNMIMRDANRSL